MNYFRKWHCFFLIVSMLLVTVLTASVSAEENMPGSILGTTGPYICHGAMENGSGEASWATGTNFNSMQCPRGYAFYGATRSGELSFEGTCCKLPAEDILTANTSEHLEICPPDSVVTGGRLNKDKYVLRCTQINLNRYQLVPSSKISTIRVASHFRERNVKLTPRRQVPLALRYGVKRKGRYRWHYNYCMGRPWGSLFTALPRLGKKCETFGFSTLQYRGLPGDPPEGTNVVMYPECNKISDVYEVGAFCQ